jgi:hypothetical protein
VIVGAVTYGLIFATGDMGVALFLGVPFAAGAVLGFTTRVSVWATVVLSVFVVLCLVFVVLSQGWHGLFCGAVLGFVFLVPVLAGAGCGALLAWTFPLLTGGYRRYLVLLLLAAAPLALHAVESRLPRSADVAEVRTALDFRAPPHDVWNSLLFYEQVEHEPPRLLTLALPRPVRTEGRKSAVGDRQVCVYRKGHLEKEVTECVADRLLRFRVTEQEIHFERDVKLLDGSFTLVPLADGGTRVVLTTRYERLLRPAWLWEPMERTIIHTLHGHVLEGMRRHQEGSGGQPPYPAPRPDKLTAAQQ